MKLDVNVKSKLAKISKSCPNCSNNQMVIVPDILGLKHADGWVDVASTICPKCSYQALFNLDLLVKVRV